MSNSTKIWPLLGFIATHILTKSCRFLISFFSTIYWDRQTYTRTDMLSLFILYNPRVHFLQTVLSVSNFFYTRAVIAAFWKMKDRTVLSITSVCCMLLPSSSSSSWKSLIKSWQTQMQGGLSHKQNVFPPVCLSVCQTRELWQNENK